MEVFDCVCPEWTPMMGNGLIYCYTLEDGRQYIGQTKKSMAERHNLHKHHSRDNNSYFDRMLEKSKFHLWIVGEYPLSEITRKEMLFIEVFNSMKPHGYNTAFVHNLSAPMGRKHARGLKNRPAICKALYSDRSFVTYRNSLVVDILNTTDIRQIDISNIKWRDVVVSDEFMIVAGDEKIVVSPRVAYRLGELYLMTNYKKPNDFVFPAVSNNGHGKGMTVHMVRYIIREYTNEKVKK